jgi:hypothetical protein
MHGSVLFIPIPCDLALSLIQTYSALETAIAFIDSPRV